MDSELNPKQSFSIAQNNAEKAEKAENKASDAIENAVAKTKEKVKKTLGSKYIETKKKKLTPKKKYNRDSDSDSSYQSKSESDSDIVKPPKKTKKLIRSKIENKKEIPIVCPKDDGYVSLEEGAIDFGNGMFSYLKAKFSFVKVGETLYIKGKDVAEFLEYADTKQAIAHHVDNDYKKTLGEIMEIKNDGGVNFTPPSPKESKNKLDGPVVFTGPSPNEKNIENLEKSEKNKPVKSTPLKNDENYKLDHLSGLKLANEKNTIYITESGLYKLITRSNKPEAEKFNKFLFEKLLPTLRKTGAYTMQQSIVNTDDISFIQSFFDNNDISKFKNCNVVYIGIIGLCQNKILCKYGKTGNIKKRLSEHKTDFGENFKLIFVGKTNNYATVENEFRDLIKSKGLNKTMMFNGEKKTELFLTTKDFDIEKAKETMLILIQNYPTEETKELELVVKNNGQILAIETEKRKTAEANAKEAEEKRKITEAKEKTKQIETETKGKTEQLKLEYEILLLKSSPEHLDAIEKIRKIQVDDKVEDKIENKTKDKKKSKAEVKAEIAKEKKNQEKRIILRFIEECTEKSDTHIKTTELYEKFKNWFKINNPNAKVPSNREFISNIKKHKTVEYVKINKSTFYGIKNIGIKDNELN
jgi:prophage antirepressor-like protein